MSNLELMYLGLAVCMISLLILQAITIRKLKSEVEGQKTLVRTYFEDIFNLNQEINYLKQEMKEQESNFRRRYKNYKNKCNAEVVRVVEMLQKQSNKAKK